MAKYNEATLNEVKRIALLNYKKELQDSYTNIVNSEVTPLVKQECCDTLTDVMTMIDYILKEEYNHA